MPPVELSISFQKKDGAQFNRVKTGPDGLRVNLKILGLEASAWTLAPHDLVDGSKKFLATLFPDDEQNQVASIIHPELLERVETYSDREIPDRKITVKARYVTE